MKLFDATFEARMRRQGLSNQEMAEALDAVADMEAERDRYREALTEVREAVSEYVGLAIPLAGEEQEFYAAEARVYAALSDATNQEEPNNGR